MYSNSLARHFSSIFHAKCLLPRLDRLLVVRSCLQNFYQWGYLCAVHILVQGCLFQRQEHSGLGTLRHWNIWQRDLSALGHVNTLDFLRHILEMKVPDKLGHIVPVLECPWCWTISVAVRCLLFNFWKLFWGVVLTKTGSCLKLYSSFNSMYEAKIASLGKFTYQE